MRGLVRRYGGLSISCSQRVRHVMGGPQELGRFENHLDDVAVAVPLCRTAGVHRQKEDVHGLLGPVAVAVTQFKFSLPTGE